VKVTEHRSLAVAALTAPPGSISLPLRARPDFETGVHGAGGDQRTEKTNAHN